MNVPTPDPTTMNKDEQLRRLLRITRYEQPPEDFAENFLEAFHRRQRTDMLHRSSLSLFLERAGTWLSGLWRPRTGYALAGAYAAILLIGWIWPSAQSTAPAQLLVTQQQRPVIIVTAPQNNQNAMSMPVSTGGNGNNLNVPEGKRRITVDPVPPPDSEKNKHLD